MRKTKLSILFVILFLTLLVVVPSQFSFSYETPRNISVDVKQTKIYPITNQNFTNDASGWVYGEVDADGVASGSWSSTGGRDDPGCYYMVHDDTSATANPTSEQWINYTFTVTSIPDSATAYASYHIIVDDVTDYHCEIRLILPNGSEYTIYTGTTYTDIVDTGWINVTVDVSAYFDQTGDYTYKLYVQTKPSTLNAKKPTNECYWDDVGIELVVTGASYSRTANQTTTVTESTGKQGSFKREGNQLVNVFETVTRSISVFRSPLISLQISEKVTAGLIYLRSIVQKLSIFDTVSILYVYGRYAGQSININDRTSRTISIFRNILQSLSIYLKISRSVSIKKSIFESLKISTFAEGARTFLRSLSQTINIFSFSQRQISILRNISQTLNINMLSERIGVYVRGLSQILNVFTSAIGEKTVNIYYRTIGQTISIKTKLVITYLRGRVVQAIINFIIEVTRSIAIIREISDTIDITPIVNVPGEEPEGGAAEGGVPPSAIPPTTAPIDPKVTVGIVSSLVIIGLLVLYYREKEGKVRRPRLTDISKKWKQGQVAVSFKVEWKVGKRKTKRVKWRKRKKWFD